MQIWKNFSLLKVAYIFIFVSCIIFFQPKIVNADAEYIPYKDLLLMDKIDKDPLYEMNIDFIRNSFTEYYETGNKGYKMVSMNGKNKNKKVTYVPLDLEMIGLEVNKRGNYILFLGFDRHFFSIEKYMWHLERDLNGEIEIYCNGNYYISVKHKDFTGLYTSTQDDRYYLIYKLDLDFTTKNARLEFYPHIKSRFPMACSFGIAYEARFDLNSLKKVIFTSSNEQIDKAQIEQHMEFYRQVQIDRVDTFLEESRGHYNISIGFRQNDNEKKNGIADFYASLRSNYNGTIEILKNNKIHDIIDYDNSESTMFFGTFRGLSYGFNDMYPGWYTFKPKIYSAEYRTFGIEIHPTYPGK